MFPVEVFQNTLSRCTLILKRAGIRFHLTGGITGTAYGEPRMTQDIDLVIDAKQAVGALDSLLEQFKQTGFLFDEPSVRRAVDSGGLFQLLDPIEALKLDIYARELIPGELDRSTNLEIFEGEWLPVVSRVDAAASKLIWINKGSHKSRRDLRAIYRNASQDEKLQMEQLAESLGLRVLFIQVLAEPDELG